jgi:hypothetical protein
VTVHFLVGVAVIANLPRLHRAFGIPRVTFSGAVILAAGVLGWSLAAEPWQLFAAALVSGIGWVTLGAAAINALVAPWFVRARPSALGMAYNGASIGGVIFSPLWVSLIAGLGFAGAAVVAGAVMVCVVAILARTVLSVTPEHLGQAPDGEVSGAASASVTRPFATPLPGRTLWRNRRFLTLATGTALGLFAQIGLIAHLFSILVPALGPQGAGLAMALATASAIAGRMLVGWLMPVRADRRLVACASYAVQVAGSLMLLAGAGTHVPLLLGGVVLFGAGIGNATSLPPLVAQAEFVPADVTRVVPLVVAIGQAAYAFAPAAFGLLRMASSGSAGGGHDTVLLFGAAALVQVLAILCFLVGRRG